MINSGIRQISIEALVIASGHTEADSAIIIDALFNNGWLLIPFTAKSPKIASSFHSEEVNELSPQD